MKAALQTKVLGGISEINAKSRRSSARLEILESRKLLSGNVLASVVNGSLRIQGDASANTLVLDQTGLTGDQVRITGNSDTSINQQTIPLVLSGITHGAVFRMGNANESVTLQNLSLAGDVSLNTQHGDSSVILMNVRIAGTLSIVNGSALSSTTISSSNVGNKLTVSGGETIALQSVGVGQNAAISSTAGGANITVNDSAFSGALRLRTRQGAEIANTTVAKNLLIFGAQNVAVQGVQVQADAEIHTGVLSANVTVDDSTFHSPVWIITGPNSDTVQIEAHGNPSGLRTLFASDLLVILNGGNDTLQLGLTGQPSNNTVFSGRVDLRGGAGYDTLRGFDATSYTGVAVFSVKNFETDGPVLDTTVPTVSSTDAANNATGVALNKKITATFSEAMDPLTITSATVTVTAPLGVAVAGSVAYVGTTMTFTPASNLAPDTLYSVEISTGAKNLSGTPLAGNYVWSFTTGATADITDPTVSSTDPVSGSTGVVLNKKITAAFSEAIDPSTITAANVTLTAPGGTPVAGAVAYVGTTMTFSPASNLAPSTAYTATITTGVKDLAGNPLASNYVWSFTTGATADTTRPTVSSTTPASGATGVALNTRVAATFSKAMDPLTITSADVSLTASGGVAVSGTVAYVGTTMTFTPASNLAPSTLYTATITTGATDLSGNALAANFVWSFTTGAAADTTDPTVTSTDPANTATGVALNKKVVAAFSEAMNPLTITSANVRLNGPGGAAVSGGVAYVGTTMTFTPTADLAPSTLYTATITTGVTDLAGNPLASSYVWSFTTGATPDTTPPTVTSTNPVDTKTNVALNKVISAIFSESIDASTVTTANFKINGPGNALVAGAVNYDAPSDTASFTSSSNFAPSTTFTATIVGGSNGVKDLAGNPLANDKVWTFTTGTQIAQAPINLGRASTFAVLATASISGTGSDEINGDVGLNPGTSQGIPTSQINGMIHVDDQTVINAQSDLLAAYNDAIGRSMTSQTLAGNMGGLTFTPGLYTNSTSVLIQGAGPSNNVTLDAQGDSNAIFIFQMGSTLTTGPGAQVILAGGAKASNVFWQVGSSATLGTTTIFKGNILASVSITVNNGSAVEGRLLAGSNSAGSVTVNGSTVTLPVP